MAVVQRGNIGIYEEDKAVWLYTHWRGFEMLGFVQYGLKYAPDQWQQAPYLARVIFQHMIGQQKKTTGFGIWCERDPDVDFEDVIVDCDLQKVFQGENTWTFSELRDLKGE